jgi:hypothetical protein
MDRNLPVPILQADAEGLMTMMKNAIQLDRRAAAAVLPVAGLVFATVHLKSGSVRPAE